MIFPKYSHDQLKVKKSRTIHTYPLSNNPKKVIFFEIIKPKNLLFDSYFVN